MSIFTKILYSEHRIVKKNRYIEDLHMKWNFMKRNYE